MNNSLDQLKILVCLYTCESDEPSLQKLKNTEWYKDINSRPNFKILEVFASEKTNSCNLLENKLTVSTAESYDNLSIKTYKMLKFCVENLDFDCLLKIDSSIIENRHKKISYLFSFEYFLEKFYQDKILGEYNGLTPILNNTIDSFRNWANSKKLFVLPEVLISEIGKKAWPDSYWGGKCYCLGRNSINKILSKPEIFEKFKNLMGGCEDMCVASALLSHE